MGGDDVGMGKSTDQLTEDKPQSKKGLGYLMTSFFLIAQMAGAGFLALPRAMADAGITSKLWNSVIFFY